jgi:hypothetical protein
VVPTGVSLSGPDTFPSILEKVRRFATSIEATRTDILPESLGVGLSDLLVFWGERGGERQSLHQRYGSPWCPSPL